jgi:threonine dehydrogenase-like Zn-dependent dehydrogenase
MLALEYQPSLSRYLAARALRGRAEPPLRLIETEPPLPPAPDWVPLAPRLSGICGSDQALLAAEASLYLAPLTSMPFVPGHEIVATITAGERRGRRVVVAPALGCRARGLEPPCPDCAEGRSGLCRALTEGHVGAGLQIGFCRETGGGWSEGLIAHRSQLHEVSDALADEEAVLVEPLACALHAVARAALPPAARAAVIGCGTLGLLAITALRERHPEATILAIAKHRGQELPARRAGADHVCPPARLHLESARVTGARRLVGYGGRELLLGGLDAVIDCVGSGASLEAAIGAVRPRGTVALAGMPAAIRADLALAWQREVEIRGVYGYEREFEQALALAPRLRLGRLVSGGFPLREFRRALASAREGARAGKPKALFDLREG